MKTLGFKTSKGSFILSDENYYLVNERGVKTAYLNNKKQFEYVSFIRLSEITEEQASEIVGSVEELHSLLKSKGYYLYENTFKNTYSIQSLEGSQKHSKQIQEAEQKTFYNPVIFKL